MWFLPHANYIMTLDEDPFSPYTLIPHELLTVATIVSYAIYYMYMYIHADVQFVQSYRTCRIQKKYIYTCMHVHVYTMYILI